MKKIIVFSLLAILAFCLPALAVEKKVAAETDYMIFKYEAYDQAKVGDKIFAVEVYEKDSEKRISREEYIFQGMNEKGIVLDKEYNGTAMRTVTDEIIPVDKDNKGTYSIELTKTKTLVLTLQGSAKKLFLFNLKD